MQDLKTREFVIMPERYKIPSIHQYFYDKSSYIEIVNSKTSSFKK